MQEAKAEQLFRDLEILGVKVSAVNLEKANKQINRWVALRQKVYICVAPVSTLVDCQRIDSYRQVINGAAMVTPDGVPVVWLSRLKGYTEIRRTYGPDLMQTVCQEGQAKQLRHFIYGSTADTLLKLQQRLKTLYPDINIVGCHSPVFSKNVGVESPRVIDQINQSKADILWVGLGSPKQDFWMTLNRPVLDVPVIVGVGAAFDFIAGTKPQAPRWIQHSGFEWFFRLCCEPKRLAKRYLVGNTLFIYFLIKRLLTNGCKL